MKTNEREWRGKRRKKKKNELDKEKEERLKDGKIYKDLTFFKSANSK